MKKIISLLLVFLMIIPFCSVSYAADYSKNESIADFLCQLNIIEENDAASASVSRAKFVDMIVKARNLEISSMGQNLFADVHAGTKYAESVYAAKEFGLISGGVDGNFYPEASINFEDAIKITVAALGYTSIATAKGGYPTGYFVVAKEIRLLNGITFDSGAPLTVDAANALVYNFLQTDICEGTGVEGENLKFERQYGKTPLTEYFGLKKVSGIVESAGFKTMNFGEVISKAQFIIDGQLFYTDMKDAEKYLGLSVQGWYDENDNMNLIFVNPINKTIMIDAKDCLGVIGGRLSVIDNDTQKENLYSLSSNLSFIKNGRIIMHSDKDFVFETGTIELIDNDGNGAYDVANVKNGEYMVISSLDAVNNVAYDKTGNVTPFSYINEKGYYSKLSFLNEDGTISEVGFDALSKDMVMTVYASDDGYISEAVATNLKTEGVINEIGEKSVKVGDKIYALNSYAPDSIRRFLGKKVVLLMAADGTVTDISDETTAEMSYGYFLDYNKKEKSLNAKVEMSLLTASGSVIYSELDDTVLFDGVRTDKTSDKIEKKFVIDGIPQYQLIKYSQNDEGKITKIDTAKSLSADVTDEERYGNDIYGEDSLTKNIGPLNACWYGGYKIFTPHTIYGTSTVMFEVPQSLSGGIATERFDENYFSVTNPSTALTNYRVYKIAAYDMDETMNAGAIVYYSSTRNVGGTDVDDMITPSICDDIVKAVNEEGEICYRLLYWKDGAFHRNEIDFDEYTRLKEKGNIPKKGDILRCNVDMMGKITGIEIDAKYDSESNFVDLTEEAPSSGQIDYSYYIGRVYASNANVLSLKVEQAADYAANYGDAPAGDIVPFVFRSDAKIAIFDTKSEKIIHGKTSILAEGRSVGMEAATKVVIYSHTHGIPVMFIYR